MFRIARYEDSFYNIYLKEKRKIVVYGAGSELRKNFNLLPQIDIICDRDAKKIVEVNGIAVIEPERLQELKESVYIIVCIRDKLIYMEICNLMQQYQIDAQIFHYFNNISFNQEYSFWRTDKSYQMASKSSKLSINIVCQDSDWIFRKFAERMCEQLSKLDVNVMVSSETNTTVDINHHIPYIAYKTYQNDTLMITHVDTTKKLALLKEQLKTAAMGICMSKQTMEKLITCGVSRGRLCYINPAHDSVIKPHKYVIGITNKCYDLNDVRKRATAILDILEGINPLYFKFLIMGDGWHKIVEKMLSMGFEVEYYPQFIYDTYNSIMQTIDYYLYIGFDEGSMGYIDALAAGAGTIVTPQGYHLDTDCSIDYSCSTVKQFKAAFLDLQKKKEKRVQSVANWTWNQYVLKHLEIWNYLLRRKSLSELYKNQLFYEDGIFSMLIEDKRI